MIRYTAELINKAKELVTEEHLSYKEIGRRLKISDSTISIWCRDIKKGNPRTYVKTSRNIRKLISKSDQDVLKHIKIDKNLAKVFCGIIYGCEGSKYPASNCMALTNSDPGILQSFIALLRSTYPLDESKWRVHLQIHDNQNFDKLSSYWSKILKIPVSKFYKPIITTARDGKHRSNYLGTCTIRYYNYQLQLKLIGVFEAFMRKSSLLEGIPNGSGDGSLNRIA